MLLLIAALAAAGVLVLAALVSLIAKSFSRRRVEVDPWVRSSVHVLERDDWGFRWID